MANPQLKDIDQIKGTYVFDTRTSNKALRLNRFLWNMIQADCREKYLANPQLAMSSAELNDAEKNLVCTEDWLGLVQYGACFFAVEKLGRVLGKTNLQIYATMRGESFEDFMATRRVPESR
jgi:hypothetical protein